MKHPVLLRMEESQYQKMHEAAQLFGESDQGFLINAALLRMQTGLSPQKGDPFGDALALLRRTQPTAALSADETAAVVAYRRSALAGHNESVPAAEGVAKLKAKIAARRALDL